MGPLVSRTHQERVLGMIDKARKQGGTLLIGGEVPAGVRGYFVKPTIFADVHHDMEIVKEEVFGPVLTVMPYDSIDDLVAKASDSKYGLAASIWSNNISKGKRSVPRIQRARSGLIVTASTNLPIGESSLRASARSTAPHLTCSRSRSRPA
jgi:phenylacetaldehyde dehydrogenase